MLEYFEALRYIATYNCSTAFRKPSQWFCSTKLAQLISHCVGFQFVLGHVSMDCDKTVTQHVFKKTSFISEAQIDTLIIAHCQEPIL